MNQGPIHRPAWASIGASENQHLPELLSFASTNWGRHTDLFLRHHENGTKNLAAILATESAIVGVAFAQKSIPAAFLATLLVILAIVGPMLAWLTISSCRRSFRAAMESVFLVAKVAWALGLTFNVAVNEYRVSASEGPGRDDKSLYGPRWVNDSLKHTTCEGFITANFANRWNTYFLAKVTTLTLGVVALALGLIGASMIAFGRR